MNNVSPIKCPVAITIFVAIVVDDNVVVVSIGFIPIASVN